ncbi:S1C family serine protease [Herbaspirillum frisingense]|nr:serine protease [Herbaspirillum frisingense]
MMNKNRNLSLPRMLTALAVMLGLNLPAYAGPATLPSIADKTPLRMPPEAQARPAFLARALRHFEQGPQVIGELQQGLFCSRKNDIVWNPKSADVLLPTNALSARFRRELQAQGYPVPAARPEILFPERPEDIAQADPNRSGEANLQVGVVVTQLQTNLCMKGGNAWTGEAYIRLDWQLFAPELRKVIYRGSSEGVFRSGSTGFEGASPQVPVEAFAVAVRNLLADPAFALAVQTPYERVAAVLPPPRAERQPPGAVVEIDNRAPDRPGSEMSKVIGELRTAVVTVFSERSSGTGFYIGSSGWLLTNHHVIGDARVVRVRLPAGRELMAEVVRSDVARDVALLKTAPPGVRPLPLRLSEPGIGEDVYALGSPLGDAFNTTLTRGILSGVRTVRDLDFLQSDVAILPGSSGGPLLDKSGQVIGITVAGLGAKGLAGMNFFIPVGSALQRLNLQLLDRPSSPMPQSSPSRSSP